MMLVCIFVSSLLGFSWFDKEIKKYIRAVYKKIDLSRVDRLSFIAIESQKKNLKRKLYKIFKQSLSM